MRRKKLENMAETLQHIKNTVRTAVEVLLRGNGTVLLSREKMQGEAIFRFFWGQKSAMSS